MNENLNLNIRYVTLDEIKPFAKNPRTHGKDQVRQVARSIAEFGFVNPIILDENGEIIAGHGRLMAAKHLNLETVPVITLSHLSEAQKRALLIADNRIAENAGWDEEKLKEILEDLDSQQYDLTITGLSNKEIENYRAEFEDSEELSELENDVPDMEERIVSKYGDLWILGDHALLCGDATSPDDMKKLMDGETATMTFTDPPYNVNYGHALRDKISGNGRGIMNDNLGEGFPAFLHDACRNMLDYTTSSFYICMGGSELHTLRHAFCEVGGKWEAYIVWVKDRFTLSKAKHQHQHEWIMYGNVHEEIMLGGKKGTPPPWYGGRNQSDVWEFPKPNKSELHPTMKPIALIERAINNSSQTIDIVLDPFGGSGSTLIAAEKTQRRCRMMELDPKYADVIVRRWQAFMGKAAVHKDSGQTFDEAFHQAMR